MSNILLAEVEGKHRCEHKGEMYGSHYICIHCDGHFHPDDNTDYPNDLEACMRVAKILKASLSINWDDDRLTVAWANGLKCRVLGTDGNVAATLYPMLVEIAERRKG